MVISLCFAQSNTIYQDSVSGFYLTQSHEGFIGENYETLILQDKPSISLSEIKKVSQNFDMLGKPAVFIVLNDSGKEKYNYLLFWRTFSHLFWKKNNFSTHNDKSYNRRRNDNQWKFHYSRN